MTAEPVALAQGGLFELEPLRSVSGPGEGWWGIDSRLEMYAVGTVDRQLKRRVHTVNLGERGTMNGERMNRYATQLRQLIRAMLHDGCPAPGAVWVEQASGKHPLPELVYCVGIATQVAYEELGRLLGYTVLVETVPSATWKARGLGNGRISKKDPETGKPWRPRERYPVVQWARLNGAMAADDGDWDKADASGIAEGCRRTIALV